MSFYEELSCFLTMAKAITILHIYGNTRDKKSHWQGPHYRRRHKKATG